MKGLTLPWMTIHKLSAELCAATSLPLSILKTGESEGGEHESLESGDGAACVDAEMRGESSRRLGGETAFVQREQARGQFGREMQRESVGRRHDIPPTARIVHPRPHAQRMHMGISQQ